MTFDSNAVADAVAVLRSGGIVLVTDDADRENEGDFVMGAQFANTDSIATFLKYTSGFICVTLPGDRVAELELPDMVTDNTESHRTAFTVTVDLKETMTTGISASERAATARALASASTGASEFARPGHVHVLREHPEGLSGRRGHTEASLELARRAGIVPAAVICEVVTRDKTAMATGDELHSIAIEAGVPEVSIAQLSHSPIDIDRSPVSNGSMLPTPLGEFHASTFDGSLGVTHLVLTHGDIRSATTPLVRIHSECVTGDVFGSQKCDCGEQLNEAMKLIVAEGAGVIVYLRNQEGRGIGLRHKMEAYELRDEGLDTIDANVALGLPVDRRNYSDGAAVLRHQGVDSVRLMTNNPEKATALEIAGVQVVELVPIRIPPNPHNENYLRTKQQRMGHLLEDSNVNQV